MVKGRRLMASAWKPMARSRDSGGPTQKALFGRCAPSGGRALHRAQTYVRAATIAQSCLVPPVGTFAIFVRMVVIRRSMLGAVGVHRPVPDCVRSRHSFLSPSLPPVCFVPCLSPHLEIATKRLTH